MNGQSECEYYRAAEHSLDCGEVLQDATLGYLTFGELNAARNNAVIIPTHFGGTHEHSQYFFGEGMAIDPAKHFIVVVNLLGNGISSSPSHGLGGEFPRITICDNVRLQHQLLTEHLNVSELALAVGHSMGAVQAFHWVTMYPDFVKHFAAICGAARISIHNHVFLEGMRGILQSDPVWDGGRYTEQPINGLATMARAWGAWPPSSHFYRHEYYKRLGFTSADDFLTRYWEAFYTQMDANNVLAQITTWQSADITRCNGSSQTFEQALRSIKARGVVMPSRTDAYFPPEDSELEVANLQNAKLRVIESQWGHWAGSGRNPEDTTYIDHQISSLLADE